MPATVTAVLMGKNSSAVRGQIACSAGATSLDVLTVNHGLGQTPQKITQNLRTINTNASGAGGPLVLLSYNATAALFMLPLAGSTATAATYDIVFERAHSLVR